MTAMSHFSSQTIQYAESAGVPFASLAVPLSGILAVLGGLSVMLGYKVKLGAWLLVLVSCTCNIFNARFLEHHRPDDETNADGNVL